MDIRKLYFLLFLPVTVCAGTIDSIPKVLYFNDNFETREIQQASYYGIVERTEKKQYEATIYTPQKLKVATVAYSGKERLLREGLAVGFHRNGTTQFIANFTKNNLNGSWVSYYENGTICDSGLILKNAPDGKWFSYYPDGTTRMYVEFNAKKLLQVKEEMRRIYRPTVISTFSNGAVVYNTPAGTRLTLPMRGPQTYLRAAYQQMLDATQPLGILGKTAGLTLKRRVDFNTISFSDQYAPPFEECLVHGLYKSYYPGGKLKDSGYSINGYRIGVWQEYAGNEQILSRGFYKKGLRRGEWKYYGKDGKFLYMRRYNRQGKEKETVMLTKGSRQ